MPNIMICGFTPKGADEIKSRVDKAMQGINLGDDAITSIINMEARSCNRARSPMPYVRIYTIDEGEIQRIIGAFRDFRIKVDIEWLVLNGFISADEMGRITA